MPLVTTELTALGGAVQQHLRTGRPPRRRQRAPGGPWTASRPGRRPGPRRSRPPRGGGCGPAAGTRSGPPARAALQRARSRQRRTPYVVVELEVRVVDPDRVGEMARDPAHPLPVPRHEREPVAGQLDQCLVVEPLRPRVEDLDRRVVARRRRRLGGQEGEIARPETIAHLPPLCWIPCPPWDSGRGVRQDRPGPLRERPQMRRLHHLITAVVLTLVASFGLVGCGSSSSSGGSGPGAAPMVIDVTFTGGRYPRTAARSRPRPVSRSASSHRRRPGEIHVHSSPEQEFDLQGGDSTRKLDPDRGPGRSPSSRTPSTRSCSCSRWR